MDLNSGDQKSQSILTLCPFYYGWFVVLLSFFANLAAAGIRSAPSVLIHPLEAEFEFTSATIIMRFSSAVAWDSSPHASVSPSIVAMRKNRRWERRPNWPACSVKISSQAA